MDTRASWRVGAYIPLVITSVLRRDVMILTSECNIPHGALTVRSCSHIRTGPILISLHGWRVREIESVDHRVSTLHKDRHASLLMSDLVVPD